MQTVSNLASRNPSQGFGDKSEPLSEDGEEAEEDGDGSEEFWYEDLVWPDPDGVWGPSSGITPMDLDTPLHGAQKAVEDGPKTVCDKARKVTRPPRPEELPWNIVTVRSDPPSVDVDDVEEFLVHDPLFVEFFNAFLSLPSFPEPICFNVETGGFEVVSDGKQKLARQIKEAVRSQQLTNRMYRVARKHAFSDIPLIPIEDDAGPEEVKIDTSYQVTTLNKEQGIYWIRAERLPIFLESDFYFTYRLAKVISQARLFNDQNEYVVMKLDFTPRPKKVKKTVEEPKPNPEDLIVKQMFISFGDVRGAAKEAFFTQAMDALKTTPTFSSLQTKVSSQVGVSSGAGDVAKDKQRPRSSVFQSKFFGVYAPGLAGPGETEPPINAKLDTDDMFTVNKPQTPRPADTIHKATNKIRRKVSRRPSAAEEMVNPGIVVKVYPKQDVQIGDDESGIGDMDERDEELERRMMERTLIDQIYNDGTWDDNNQIALATLDDLGSVIVGAVMKKAMADLLGQDEKTIIQDPKISSLYPSQELTCVSVGSLDLCAVVGKEAADYGWEIKKEMGKEKTENLENELETPKEASAVKISSSHKPLPGKKESEIPKESGKCSRRDSMIPKAKDQVHMKWGKSVHKPAEEESDADSLLDSDEDFEERDVHFRRNKDKWHSLTALKGIMEFKKFLEGTSGEKYWELWIDIDKGHLIADEEEKQQFIMHMRSRYYQHGSYYELSAEDKKKLGLENLSAWCPEYLFQVQARVLEPLILYWAPRYLLKHLVRSQPERYPVYSQIKSTAPQKEADPHPHTRPLLPLGPKSCCPRRSSGPGSEEFENAKTNIYKYNEAEFATTPRVGNRRTYGTDTIRRLAQTPTARYLGIKPQTKAATQHTKTKEAGHSCPVDQETSIRNLVQKNKHSGSLRSSQDSTPVENIPNPPISTGVPAARPSTGAGGAVKKSPEASFVGKLPGVSPRHSHRGTSDPPSSTNLTRPTSSTASRPQKMPCPIRPLTAVLGEGAAERHVPAKPLAPVKKPKDLLSPMLKIVDTKGPRSRRIASAPPTRSQDDRESKTTFYRQDSQDSSKTCDRRSSMGVPGDEMIDFAEMKDCDFMGSERMEFLLQALHNEHSSGKTFRKYIEKSERSDWMNNLDFWEQVQEYRKLFYKDKLDLFLIAKLAKSIFAKCIVECSSQNIGVSDSIELLVMERLNPAYEDLFDEAEEHALKVLFEAFQLYLSQDVKTYCKVERSEVTRRLETKNTYILDLQKKGIIKEGPLTPDDPMEGFVEPVCDESILERIPPEFRDWTLDKLLHNRLELEAFRQYLAENYAEMDLKCWMDMEAWRRTPPDDERKRDQRARDIKKNYLNRKYFFGPSSPAGKEGQNKVMEVGGGWGKFLEDKPHSDSILEAQKYVRERLEKKHLPLFLLSTEFQNRQSPRLSMADSAEDVMVQKKRRSQAVLKVMLKNTEEVFLSHRGGDPVFRGKRMSYSVFPQIQEHQKFLIKRMSLLPTDALPPIGEDYRFLRYQSFEHFLLESKWVSSTKEIFLFQQALQNPITCKLFRKFVALKGDNLENDVLFWLEVQNYKRLNHGHTDDAILTQKINAIIHCFIDSTIPPALQIDIPQEMADRVMDHKHEKGPYLFREAQLACFRILLTHWQPFCEFRNNMNTDERALTTLERHRIIARKKETIRREEMQLQAERERLIRLELGLGENDELPDHLFDEEEQEDTGVIAFSYEKYLADLKDKAAGIESSSFYNLNLTSYEDNTSQTVRGIPMVKGQPIHKRPGYEEEETQDLQHRMYNYDATDCENYYNYIIQTEGKLRLSKNQKKTPPESDESAGTM